MTEWLDRLRPYAAWAALLLSAMASAAELPRLSASELAAIDASIPRPFMLVTRASDREYHRVELLTLDPKTLRPLTRTPTPLGCTRLHAADAGQVFCFTKVLPGKPKYYSGPTGYFYGSDFAQSTRYKTSRGIISRARVSRDGRYVASTAFTTGHSYLGVGGSQFSTATFIANAKDGKSEEDIQQWSVLKAGKPITSTDLNLWGVSFDPKQSDRFFVTAYFDGAPHLAEGSVAAKRITIVRESVECPSFSPDGQRLAFKKRTGPTRWSPAVLNLQTMQETVYTVADSVDDQIEWLDASTLIYEVTDTPLVGKPSVNLVTLDLREAAPTQKLWLEDARSPTVVRAVQ
jgi:dipeptidyl aminopeptidase/acylaminoacyl peptidase